MLEILTRGIFFRFFGLFAPFCFTVIAKCRSLIGGFLTLHLISLNSPVASPTCLTIQCCPVISEWTCNFVLQTQTLLLSAFPLTGFVFAKDIQSSYSLCLCALQKQRTLHVSERVREERENMKWVSIFTLLLLSHSPLTTFAEDGNVPLLQSLFFLPLIFSSFSLSSKTRSCGYMVILIHLFFSFHFNFCDSNDKVY